MGVHKRGDHYVIDYYFEGQRVRETIGTSKRQAEQVLTQRKADIINGKFKLPTEGKATFGEAAEKYMAWSRQHKRSWQSDEYMLIFLSGIFGERLIGQISTWQVEQLKSKLQKDGVSGARINRYLACLSGLFSRAIEWGLLQGENPLRKVRRFRESPGRLRYLGQEDIMRLLDACGEQLKPVVQVAIATGMRRGEIFSLCWENVDLCQGMIHVVDSKNGSRREIPMPSCLLPVFQGLRHGAPTGLVFAAADGESWKSGMRTAWLNTCKRAGLTNLRFHDLRHTFASQLVMAGKSEFAVQQLLGHRTLAMTRRYSHLSPGALREAVNVMDGFLNAAEESDAPRWSQNGHKQAKIA